MHGMHWYELIAAWGWFVQSRPDQAGIHWMIGQSCWIRRLSGDYSWRYRPCWMTGRIDMATKKTHPSGRYYGETKREFRARLRGIDTRPVLERKILANQFDADRKLHGLSEAMRLHGITE
jgi:hypothetical protein